MTEQEIQQIINKDKLAINNAPFPEKLPEWLLTNFDEIIMGERQNVNPYTAEVLESVLSKKDDPSKLTVYEGGWVLNVLSAVCPYLISPDIKDFIKKKKIFNEITIKFNIGMDKELRKVEAKEANLRKNNRKMILT